jgi:hypothetical protein
MLKTPPLTSNMQLLLLMQGNNALPGHEGWIACISDCYSAWIPYLHDPHSDNNENISDTMVPSPPYSTTSASDGEFHGRQMMAHKGTFRRQALEIS